MSQSTSGTVAEFLSDVEKTNGVPQILSLYGFRKMDLEGKTYLVPMTIEESARMHAEARGISESKALEELSKRSWAGEPSWCSGGGDWQNFRPLGNCKACDWDMVGGGIDCFCAVD